MCGFWFLDTSFCTCIVILSAVAQILLLFQHKLWEGEVISHLDGAVRQPLEDQVIHGVTNCEENGDEEEAEDI